MGISSSIDECILVDAYGVFFTHAFTQLTRCIDNSGGSTQGLIPALDQISTTGLILLDEKDITVRWSDIEKVFGFSRHNNVERQLRQSVFVNAISEVGLWC